MQCIAKTADIEITITPGENGQWTIALSAFYHQSLLSLLFGLLASRFFRVRTGRFESVGEKIHASGDSSRERTDRGACRESAPRKVRALLTVRPRLCRDAQPYAWEPFKANLRQLAAETAAGNTDRVRAAFVEELCAVRRVMPPLLPRPLPVSVHWDSQSRVSVAAQHIRPDETAGFFFALTNSMAMLNIHFIRGDVRFLDQRATASLWLGGPDGETPGDTAALKRCVQAALAINRFTCFLPLSADPGMALRQFGELVAQIMNRPEWPRALEDLRSPDVMVTLAAMMGSSQFLWNDFLRLQHENMFPLIRNPTRLDAVPDEKGLARCLDEEMAAVAGVKGKAAVINCFKDREMFRIDLRYITQRSTVLGFSRELTALADVVVRRLISLCRQQLAPRYGLPRLEDGSRCDFSALAVGKFGGAEMGVASDIELLFVYGGDGETDGDEKLRNSAYFEKLVGAFLQAVKRKCDGFFDVDLRLRPFGEKGTLATSLNAFCEYYAENGAARQFERLSLVKLRPITGGKSLVARTMAARDAFVYSNLPVDYANIRHLRALQVKTFAKGPMPHAKYSHGGLVDLEYFIQAQQIEHGERLARIRVANTMIALARLQGADLIPGRLASKILTAYHFMRRLIDALRLIRGNAKDLCIPLDDARTLGYLSRRMGYRHGVELESDLARSMEFGKSLWTTVADDGDDGNPM